MQAIIPLLQIPVYSKRMENLQAQQRHLKFNLAVNLADGGFFGFALGFASFSTIIPLFVSGLTDSAVLIGLIPAIHNVGWQFPQLFSAGRLSRLESFKPYVSAMTILERIPFLFLALIALLQNRMSVTLALVLTFASLIFQGLGAGLTANAWQNMISRVIPSDMRTIFFGLQNAASNLLASVGAILAGYLLDFYPSPSGFSRCFFIAFGLMVFSWVAITLTREEKRPKKCLECVPVPLLSTIKRILARDKGFLWFLISRIIWQFGMMAFAFYIVYASRTFNMDQITAGVMTSVLFITQVVVNPLAGWLFDRWDRKVMLVIGGITTLLGPLLAFLAPSLAWFYPVFILNGISNTAFWTLGISFTLEFGTDENRPMYVGMANTLIAPAAILAPLLGGWLADAAGYHTTFLVSAVFGLLTMLCLILFVHDPRKKGHSA